jgi:hypothetical protein
MEETSFNELASAISDIGYQLKEGQAARLNLKLFRLKLVALLGLVSMTLITVIFSFEII